MMTNTKPLLELPSLKMYESDEICYSRVVPANYFMSNSVNNIQEKSASSFKAFHDDFTLNSDETISRNPRFFDVVNQSPYWEVLSVYAPSAKELTIEQLYMTFFVRLYDGRYGLFTMPTVELTKEYIAEGFPLNLFNHLVIFENSKSLVKHYEKFGPLFSNDDFFVECVNKTIEDKGEKNITRNTVMVTNDFVEAKKYYYLKMAGVNLSDREECLAHVYTVSAVCNNHKSYDKISVNKLIHQFEDFFYALPTSIADIIYGKAVYKTAEQHLNDSHNKTNSKSKSEILEQSLSALTINGLEESLTDSQLECEKIMMAIIADGLVKGNMNFSNDDAFDKASNLHTTLNKCLPTGGVVIASEILRCDVLLSKDLLHSFFTRYTHSQLKGNCSLLIETIVNESDTNVRLSNLFNILTLISNKDESAYSAFTEYLNTHYYDCRLKF